MVFTPIWPEHGVNALKNNGLKQWTMEQPPYISSNLDRYSHIIGSEWNHNPFSFIKGFSPLQHPPQPTPSTNSGNTSVAMAQRPLLVTKLRQVPKVPLSSLADFKPSIPCSFIAAAQRAKCGNVVKREAPIKKNLHIFPTEKTGLLITRWTLNRS